VKPATALKYLWASPATALGALLGLAAGLLGARLRVHTGVLEVNLGPGRERSAGGSASRSASRLARGQASAIARLPFSAITLGHVVLAVSASAQEALRCHERAHVAQFERWGALLLLAYPAESLLQCLLGRHPYLDNRFEVAARIAEAQSAHHAARHFTR